MNLASESPIEVAGLRPTHPDCVLYADQAISKRALARYYEAVVDWIVPHVTGRPLSLVRCPEGQRRGQCFLQRHAWPSVPKNFTRSIVSRRTPEVTDPVLIVEDVTNRQEVPTIRSIGTCLASSFCGP